MDTSNPVGIQHPNDLKIVDQVHLQIYSLTTSSTSILHKPSSPMGLEAMVVFLEKKFFLHALSLEHTVPVPV
jgi:hypothetical protein